MTMSHTTTVLVHQGKSFSSTRMMATRKKQLQRCKKTLKAALKTKNGMVEQPLSITAVAGTTVAVVEQPLYITAVVGDTTEAVVERPLFITAVVGTMEAVVEQQSFIAAVGEDTGTVAVVARPLCITHVAITDEEQPLSSDLLSRSP